MADKVLYHAPNNIIIFVNSGYMALFKNKYRIESARLQTWDYSSNAPYFMTICTKEKEQFFGRIVNDDMHLSAIGIVAKKMLGRNTRSFSVCGIKRVRNYA